MRHDRQWCLVDTTTRNAFELLDHVCKSKLALIITKPSTSIVILGSLRSCQCSGLLIGAHVGSETNKAATCICDPFGDVLVPVVAPCQPLHIAAEGSGCNRTAIKSSDHFSVVLKYRLGHCLGDIREGNATSL